MFVEKIKHVIQLCKLRAAEGHLSVSRQVLEMISLRIMSGVGLEYYHTAKLWRKELSWQFKRNHLGSTQYSHCLAKINPVAYRKISQNKLSEKGLLRLFNIPSTGYLGYFCERSGQAIDGAPLRNSEQLETFLRSHAPGQVCFKPTEGWAGSGFSAIELVPGIENLLVKNLQSDEKSNVQSFVTANLPLNDTSGWIIEKYFQQHTLLDGFNASSLNTLRVWVMKSEKSADGNVLGAFLRLGRKGAVVDNQAGNRIVANVDLASGRLDAASDGTPELTTYACHPDSGEVIQGKVVPHWDVVKQLCIDTLAIFPETNFAGMDIAIGPDYPVVVELNVCPDKEGAAFMDIAPGNWFSAKS